MRDITINNNSENMSIAEIQATTKYQLQDAIGFLAVAHWNVWNQVCIDVYGNGNVEAVYSNKNSKAILRTLGTYNRRTTTKYTFQNYNEINRTIPE